MTFLLIVIRVLIVLLILRFALRLIASARAGYRTAPRQPGHVSERIAGTLVRDPYCGTHILESRAVTAGTGRDVVHFCSTKCRDAYAAARHGRVSAGRS